MIRRTTILLPLVAFLMGMAGSPKAQDGQGRRSGVPMMNRLPARALARLVAIEAMMIEAPTAIGTLMPCQPFQPLFDGPFTFGSTAKLLDNLSPHFWAMQTDASWENGYMRAVCWTDADKASYDC